MESLNNKIATYSFRWRFVIICCITLLLYIPYAAFYLLDDASISTQLISCALHLFVLWLSMKHLYPREAPSEQYRNLLMGSIVVAIMINFIPFTQGYTPHDNGFYGMDEIMPQTNFGLPHIYLRIFNLAPEDLREYELPSIIFYPGTIFSNAFKLSLLTALLVRMRYYFQDSASLWTTKSQD